jgi:hypothetical protein
VGTDQNSYRPVVADVGNTITVTVTTSGNTGSVTSAPTTAVVVAPSSSLDAATITNADNLAAYITANCANGTALAPKVMPFTGAITTANLDTVREAVNTASTYVIWDLSAVTGSLTAKTGYTFTGVAANSFTYTGATTVTNTVNNRLVTITFPAAEDAPVQPPSLTAEIIADATALATYLTTYCAGGTASAPKVMPFTGAITPDNLITVREAVNTAETYVIWDLSAVTGSLTDIEIGDTIDAATDTGRDKIKGLVLPTGITTIGTEAFYGCTSLTSVALPTGLISIGDAAFSGCTGLTSVTLPANLTSIGGGAFADCTCLPSVTLPVNLTTIGAVAFSRCTILTFTTSGEVWTTDTSGKILIKDGNTVVAGSGASGEVNLTSFTSLTSIDTYAFHGCTSLTSVALPAGLISIGDGAFAGCTSLPSVTLPASLTSIGAVAFSGCKILATVVFEGNDVLIGNINSFPGSSITSSSLKTVYETGKSGSNKGVAGTYTRTPATSAVVGSWSRN